MFRRIGSGKLRCNFKSVVCAAAVAAGVTGDQFQRFVIGPEFQRTESALAIGQRPLEQRDDLLFFQRLQHVDAAAREQRRDDFERRILGGRANQADRSPLHIGQKRILLRFVEAVNLVDEENGSRVHLGGLGRIGHHLLDLFDAAGDGGELDEGGLGGFGNDLGKSGFAHARRTPEDHRAGVVALDLHAQRLAGADEMLLPEQFVQAARAHSLR